MKFNLEKALAGHLVMLRDGRTAQIMADLQENKYGAVFSHPIVGVIEKVRSSQNYMMMWRDDGRIFEEVDRPNDIVGMAPTAVFNHWVCLNPMWKFIAADNDGDAYLFQSPPVKNKEEGIWETTDGIQRCVEGLFDFKYADWETSLVERPV